MIEHQPVDRREFLKTSGIATASAALAASAIGSAVGADGQASPLKKTLKFGMVQVPGSLLDKFRVVKDVGFEGVELDSPTLFKKDDILRARDETGLVIDGTVDAAHWTEPLSHPDPQVRARALEALKTALRETKLFGGTSVLLVPAVVSKAVSYDDAYKRSQAEIRKVLPLAQELDIKIAIENVWNNFLVSPLEMARYLDEFESPMVRAHFDVGNVMRYGWPEQWIRILNKRIYKIDIKEYSLKKQSNEGLSKGFAVELLEGDCDWPAVMAALREINFSGWAAAEIPGGGRQRLADISKRMDRIFAL